MAFAFSKPSPSRTELGGAAGSAATLKIAASVRKISTHSGPKLGVGDEAASVLFQDQTISQAIEEFVGRELAVIAIGPK